MILDKGLKLKYALNTHCHADHITGTKALKEKFASAKSVISKASRCQADLKLEPGDKVSVINSHCAEQACSESGSTACKGHVTGGLW